MTAEPFLWCELVGNLPALAAAKWGRRPALTFADRTWLYEEAAHEVEVIVRALHATGVRKGDRVAVWLTNSPEIQFLIFAICRLGAVVVPLNTRLKAMELSFALRHSGSVLLVAGKRSGAVDFEEVLNEAVGTSTASAGRPVFEHTPQLRLIVTLGDATLPNCPDWASFLASGHAEPVEAPALDPSDVAMMMFTSGTTGQPKGVLLSHAGLRLCYDRARIMKMTPDDVQLTYLPLFHIYAIGYSMFMSFMSGASQVLMDHFNGDEAQ